MTTSALLLTIALSSFSLTAATAADSPKTVAKPVPADTVLVVQDGETGSLPAAQPRICRKQARPATNIPGRTVCLTSTQWDRLTRDPGARVHRSTTSRR